MAGAAQFLEAAGSSETTVAPEAIRSAKAPAALRGNLNAVPFGRYSAFTPIFEPKDDQLE